MAIPNNTLTVPELTGGEFHERIAPTLESWQGVKSLDVQQSMPNVRKISLDERSVGAVILDPEGKDFNEELVLALGLPHMNGWSPQHAIRARTLQQTVAPDSRVIVFPDNSFGNKHNHYTRSDKKRMSRGDSLPIAEAQMLALEALATELGIKGVLSTGYSKAGRSALGLAAVGSDKLEVKAVNADETPSKEGRGLAGLGIDFMTSGTDVAAAAKASRIPALSEIMNPWDLNIDFIKFAVSNADPRNLSEIRSMTGSAGWIALKAAEQIGGDNIKLGYVEGSKLFDPDSVTEASEQGVTVEHYEGSELLGHASGDNVVLHAAMAYRGLKNVLQEHH